MMSFKVLHLAQSWHAFMPHSQQVGGRLLSISDGVPSNRDKFRISLYVPSNVRLHECNA